MPIDFPSSPTTNQTYTYNNKLWVYNGSAWVGGTVVSLLPAGSMQMYAGAITQSASAGVITTTCPSNWLLCNGDLISRTTYSALFSAIGTTYGAGNGSTTFALPDMRSRVPISVGTGSGLTARTLGGVVGAESHTVAKANIQEFLSSNMNANATHNHYLNMSAYNGTGNYTAVGYNGPLYPANGVTESASTEHQHWIGSASPTAINHMPPSIGLNFIIKT